MQEQKVSEDLCKSIKDTQQSDLELIGYRKSIIKYSCNVYDVLLSDEHSYAFSILYNEDN
jgi:hypothetical protein